MKRATRTLLLLSLFSGLQFSLSAQSTQQIISNYLQEHASEWNLEKTDVSEIEIVSESSSLAKDAKHVYIRQLKNGWPVVNGLASVTMKNNQVFHVAPSLVSLKTENIPSAMLTAEEAVKKAFVLIGLPNPTLTVLSENKKDHSVVFDKGLYSNEHIPARLFLEFANGKLQYVWDLSIYPIGSNDWWSMRLSATDGTLLFRNNWITTCSFESCDSEEHAHTSMFAPPPPPPGADQYRVYALPAESPNHANSSVLVDPSDNIFSPLGWHDTNGSLGDEFTITRGNNVFAYEDKDNDNQPGYSPDGGPSLDFNFIYDSIGGVEGNLDPIITNLFYLNNMMHDIWAYYGFDEQSGNFQEHNFSNDGNDGDGVKAEAQDGSGTDNANFATPPDGSHPRMQMYLWNFSGYNPTLFVNDPDSISGAYTAGSASFGPSITPSTSITGDVVLVLDDGVDTLDACGIITNGAALNGKIALIRRGNCSNTDKVLTCQNLGAIAVIVMQPVNESPGTLVGSVPQNTPILIPTIVIGKSNSDSLVDVIRNGGTVNVTLGANGSADTYDSDLDNGVIAHEYGHGISNRLIGGSGNTNCMYNNEQLGEGWSDWLALMITMKVGDEGTDARGMATYLEGQSVNGLGIRPARYSTDFGYNNFTFQSSNTLTEAHGRGFVWTTMLWDLNWALIDEYGFDPNFKTGTGGNNVAMSLIIEGLKQTTCGGGFVDARDGILAADQLLYGGDNECLIWNAFAKRGLGFSADQGDPDIADDQFESFDVPPGCLNGLNEGEIQRLLVYPNPGTDQVTVDFANCKNPQVMTVVDLAGKVIVTKQLSADKTVTVNLSALNKGIYLIRVSDDNGVHVIEWVKQ